ncbi:MAG: OmpA family protein [Verrucomicrobia bacterium]|nr:OmpA family protein [Verrucomicrobiota bacterium]
MKALFASLAAILVLLASGFTYAHQRIYQRRFERDLMDQAGRALRARPEFQRVGVSFEGLDARLSGAVDDPRHRALAQEIINQIPGARAVAARNLIRVSPWLKIESAPGAGWRATGWMPSPAWRDRAAILISPGAGPGAPFSWEGVQIDSSVTEPVFLNHPALPSLAKSFIAGVSNGVMDAQLTRVRLNGKTRTEADRSQIAQLARQIWNGFGGSTVEDQMETPAAANVSASRSRDFSWAGFDMPRVARSFPIFFDPNSSTIKPDELGKAERLASAIRQLAPQGRFTVKGIADGSGNAAANQRMAQKRADAVVTQLLQYGVRKEQLATRVQTEKLSAPEAKSAEAKRRLRRVELSLP